MRVFSLPGRKSGNPYVDLFYDALLPHGIEHVGQLYFDKQWFSNHANEFDAIHLHWPENLWRQHLDSKLSRLRKSGIKGSWRLSCWLEKEFSNYWSKKATRWFEEVLCFLRTHNKKIIWTWHNVEPHENVNEIDIRGQKILANYADLLIFHSYFTEQQCRKYYDFDCETVIMSHGNYEGVYPIPRDRNNVIDELGLKPDLPIVGCLGGIRDYKGLDVAADACELIGEKVQFLCAGNPHPSFDLDAFRSRIDVIDNAVLVPRFITDQEFSDYANLCDILLLPYKHVTGSGALLAALTLGKGVIASDLPFFREVLDQSTDAGRLVPLGDSKILSVEIVKYLQVYEKKRYKAAKMLANNYRWDKVIQPVANKLNKLFYL